MKKIFLSLAIILPVLMFAQDSSKNNFLVRTNTKLPNMEFGPGDDRLGGAKMTYLDTSILLKVVDSLGEDYIVQLSQNHKAFIQKVLVIKDSISLNKKYHLTTNWKVYGDSLYDYISVVIDEHLPYRSIQQINPTEIMVDIFGATTNTNWITQYQSLKEIKSTWYEQIEDDVMRIHIDLNHPQIWGYNISYFNDSLRIKIKRPPSKNRMITVAIDAGHGGGNTGAEGITSHIAEKTFTLEFAKELEDELLEKGFNVFMTRTKDTGIEMADRVLMLRKEDPDLLISLHLNSSNYDSVEGTSTYYRYIGFRPLTQFILKRMEDLGLSDYGNTGAFNFGLSGPTEYPNCLVEIAFLSNREDEKLIMSKAFQKSVAQQIELGIEDWLKDCGVEK